MWLVLLVWVNFGLLGRVMVVIIVCLVGLIMLVEVLWLLKVNMWCEVEL